MDNLIGGEKRKSADKKVVDIINPVNNKKIDTVPYSTYKDINYIINMLDNSTEKWREMTIEERIVGIIEFKELVEKNKNDLANLLSTESGQCIKETKMEIAKISNYVNNYIKLSKDKYHVHKYDLVDNVTIYEPLGIVAVIIPYNYAIDFFCQKVLSAILMGNVVIVKPSIYNPLTIHRLCELLCETIIPKKIVNCISGSNPLIIKELSNHPDISLVVKAGPDTIEQDGYNMSVIKNINIYGNNCLIATNDCDLDLVSNKIIENRLYNAGQSCMAINRFFVDEEIKEELINVLISKISKIQVGMPLKKSTDIGCLYNIYESAKLHKKIRHLVLEGAHIVIGGRIKNSFFEPTIMDNISPKMDIMHDYILEGPIIPLYTFKSIDEVISLVNESKITPYCSIFANDKNTFKKCILNIKSNNIIINDVFKEKLSQDINDYEYISENLGKELELMSKIKKVIVQK